MEAILNGPPTSLDKALDAGREPCKSRLTAARGAFRTSRDSRIRRPTGTRSGRVIPNSTDQARAHAAPSGGQLQPVLSITGPSTFKRNWADSSALRTPSPEQGGRSRGGRNEMWTQRFAPWSLVVPVEYLQVIAVRARWLSEASAGAEAADPLWSDRRDLPSGRRAGHAGARPTPGSFELQRSWLDQSTSSQFDASTRKERP